MIGNFETDCDVPADECRAAAAAGAERGSPCHSEGEQLVERLQVFREAVVGRDESSCVMLCPCLMTGLPDTAAAVLLWTSSADKHCR